MTLDDAGVDDLARSVFVEHDAHLFAGGSCAADEPDCVERRIGVHIKAARAGCLSYEDRGPGVSSERRVQEAALEASRERRGKCDNVGNFGTSRRRVALAFFGVNRSLRRTIRSIRERIFSPLDALCVEYEVFVATYDTGEAHNPRAGEYRVDLRATGWRELLEVLRPVDYSVMDQAAFIESINLDEWTSDANESVGLPSPRGPQRTRPSWSPST